MGDALNIALTIKATDLASDVVRRFDARVSQSNKQVRDEYAKTKQFMLDASKGIATSLLVLNRIRPGVDAAADMQQSMISVKMNLAGSIRDAKSLDAALSEVQATAIGVSSNMQFSAEDVVNIQGTLLKAGVQLKDVAGESGAA